MKEALDLVSFLLGTTKNLFQRFITRFLLTRRTKLLKKIQLRKYEEIDITIMKNSYNLCNVI